MTFAMELDIILLSKDAFIRLVNNALLNLLLYVTVLNLCRLTIVIVSIVTNCACYG